MNNHQDLLLTFFGIVLLTLALSCGGGGSGGGGGTGSTPPPPQSNPQPDIVSLKPSSATVGSAGLYLTVAGEGFVSSSAVQWNGSPRQTTFGSSTQLQVQITDSDLASAETDLVTVINPAPGGGNSGPAEFVVGLSSNPAPLLATLSPSSIAAGSGSFLLTLTGSDFVPGSTVQWNGTTIVSTYLSDRLLELQVPAEDVTTSGFAGVMVSNPAPGGGSSIVLPFSITYGPTVVQQAANDLVWDSANQLVYVSVPSMAATNGNTITAINPLTGTVQRSQYAGSEPDVLAISDDDQYLYAGVEGASSVQRFQLPGLTPDISYSLGADPTFGPYAAYDLQVAPGVAHTAAVSRGLSNLSSAIGGMAIYDDASERSRVAYSSGNLYDSIQWGSDTALYANNGEVSSFDFYTLAVNGSGVVQTSDYQNVFSGFYISIHYDRGTKLIYGDDGTIVNPTSGQIVGLFQASGLMVPDSTLNSAFFLGQTQSQFGTTSYTIESFDLTTLNPAAEIVISGVQGFPLHLIRWGTNGLAFNDNAGYVYILNSPFVTAEGKRVITPKRFFSPIKRVGSFSKSIHPQKGVVEMQRTKPRVDRRFATASSDSNPPPSLDAVTPNTVEAGVSDFTMTVTGSNFLSYSTIQLNGIPLPTEYVSSGELQALVSSSYVSSPMTSEITVFTPSPGGGVSINLPFTALAASENPTPVIISLYPPSVAAGSAGLTLNINGLTYFNASSVVLWNGVPRHASFYSSGQLQLQVSAADIANPGYAAISVYNPGPGGGSSNIAEFQILFQPLIVDQYSKDMVWDAKNQVIYISIPSSAATHPNQVCALNPVTGSIGTCQSGNEPDVLAISDDSQYLYVGMDGSNSVQRFILPSMTPDISYPLPNDSNGGPYYALDLQVAPGASHTTAVSKGTMTDPPGTGGIVVYDDATPRPVTAEGWGPTTDSYDSIQWGIDATHLYGANKSTTGFDFYTLDVSSSGVVLSTDYPELWWNPGRIHFDSGSGLVYSDDGFHAVNPTTGLPAGLFEVGGDAPMAPDSSLNTVFILAKYIWQENGNYTIDLFDMTHYVPITWVPFSTTPNGILSFGRFIRWGSNGLAVNDTRGNIYIISAPFVNGSHSTKGQVRQQQNCSSTTYRRSKL